MSNLIDRQAAIDAFDGVKVDEENCTEYDIGYNDGIDFAISKLSVLPPAQLEPNYDEWCTDCKEYDHENSCCPRWTKVIRQTRRELQDEFVMTAVDGTLWVTVDDVQKVGRVIVDEEKSKFCRQFYMDAQPEQHIDADGTLWITVPDIDRVKRVIVDEDKSKFCRQFYLEEEQRTGHWHITDAYPHNVYCSECHKRFAQTHWAVWEDGSLPRNFCPNCGAKMEGVNNEID